jgi:transposase
MPKEQRTFTKDDLGIADSTLSHWCQELANHGAHSFPGSGHQTLQEEELRRLRRELEVTRQERDILKKALAIFSRTQS